jgi:hypothetical protein
MKINSKEARTILDTNNYVVFRNYATPPDASLFDKAFSWRPDVNNSDDGKSLASMKKLPEYFLENENVSNFINECSNTYGVKTTHLIIEGRIDGEGTTKHSDESDVIHWQCMGKSEWTFYDNPTDSIQFETKIILNAGDVVWFKKGKDHSVENLQAKFSIIFMSNDILKDFLTRQYAAAGREFI